MKQKTPKYMYEFSEFLEDEFVRLESRLTQNKCGCEDMCYYDEIQMGKVLDRLDSIEVLLMNLKC